MTVFATEMPQRWSQFCECRRKALSELPLPGAPCCRSLWQRGIRHLPCCMSSSRECNIRCFLIYSPSGPLACPVVAHPDSSPAGRVEVYLSQKNQSPGGYRALLACGNCGGQPSEAEETSQVSCFLDEGATASCPG